MNRNDLIIAINNIFDENIDLKVKNEFLEMYKKEKESVKCSVEEKTEINQLDLKMIEYGKKQLADKVLKSWGNEVIVNRDEETNKIKTTTYQNWLNKKIYDSEIPNDMSKTEVLNVIYDIALEKYEEEKKEAIKKFEEKELEKKKGGEENE